MKRTIIFDTEGVASGCPISDIGTTTILECQDCDWCLEIDGVTAVCEKECDCQDNEVVNCDGEFHRHFCGACNKDMGITSCEGL